MKATVTIKDRSQRPNAGLSVAWRELAGVCALCLGIAVYWYVLERHTIRQAPLYLGEMKAITGANWRTMWTWTDYGGYYRYSPTALLAFGLLDRHVIAPLLGIPFPGPAFTTATRLIPVYVLAIALIAFVMYRFCRFVGLDVPAAIVAAVFMGFNKGFAYYFTFASTIATFLLIMYGFGILFFAARYLRQGRSTDLAGYYASLLLSVGAWEQWINWVFFLVPASLFAALMFCRYRRTSLIIHGVVVPVLIAATYVALRYPTIHKESSSISEAQYVFSYPSKAVMVEDIVVNASLHIASIVEPVLFPWPMMSQSVIRNQNMAAFNPYNSGYTAFPVIHYRGFGDWYAGLLFGLFAAVTIWLLVFAARHREEIGPVGIGLGLTYCGFVAHLPIMYRTYFVLPGYASLLDYKHPLSIVGFSVLLGWGVSAGSRKLAAGSVRLAAVAAFCGWIAYCNYGKVVTEYRFQQGVFPW